MVFRGQNFDKKSLYFKGYTAKRSVVLNKLLKSCGTQSGGAENAGLENAGVAKMQGWKTRDWKMQESEKYGKRRFKKCVSDCTD